MIPARYGSTRFPGKPLALICNKPMIQHVYERCLRAKLLDKVVVATDDDRIFNCVTGFGGQAVMTSSKHRSGSDRLAEVVMKKPFRNFGIIINIQGDEPLISSRAIDLLASAMLKNPNELMATVATKFKTHSEIENPNTAKLVIDKTSRAIYFSRCPIPFIRSQTKTSKTSYLKHVGIYAYHREFLLKFTKWPLGKLEDLEQLEQLRAIENGIPIKIITCDYNGPAVDVPKDLIKIRAFARNLGKSAKTRV